MTGKITLVAAVALLFAFGFLQWEYTGNVACLFQGAETVTKEESNRTTAVSQMGSPQKTHYTQYQPAPVEYHVVTHLEELGYTSPANPTGCNIWRDPNTNPYFNQSKAFKEEMVHYSKLLGEFAGAEEDLRVSMKRTPDKKQEICQALRLHEDGLPGLFPSQQISYSRAGYVEPLLPPMRHPDICIARSHLMRMDYMIHDFERMCLDLNPNGNNILIDMGASLNFHAGMASPAMYITKLYEKFGFKFDHIYAFEVTKQDPVNVYQKVPKELMSSYHWINVGVNPAQGSQMNPLSSILSSFNKDDFIVVKLDVDTPWIENALTQQLLADESLTDKVDQFYFEHHVHLGELALNWKKTMNGTIADSLTLFHTLRKKGVASHFWP